MSYFWLYHNLDLINRVTRSLGDLGMFIAGVGVLLMAVSLFKQLRQGPPAPPAPPAPSPVPVPPESPPELLSEASPSHYNWAAEWKACNAHLPSRILDLQDEP